MVAFAAGCVMRRYRGSGRPQTPPERTRVDGLALRRSYLGPQDLVRATRPSVPASDPQRRGRARGHAAGVTSSCAMTHDRGSRSGGQWIRETPRAWRRCTLKWAAATSESVRPTGVDAGAGGTGSGCLACRAQTQLPMGRAFCDEGGWPAGAGECPGLRAVWMPSSPRTATPSTFDVS